MLLVYIYVTSTSCETAVVPSLGIIDLLVAQSSVGSMPLENNGWSGKILLERRAREGVASLLFDGGSNRTIPGPP